VFSEALYWLFLLAIAVQFSYAFYFFIRIIPVRKAGPLPASELQPVSIIICAKNEASNLKKNLPAILSQKYDGEFEVIVVDDASGDDTGIVLKSLKEKFNNLKEMAISSFEQRSFKGKKYALSKGVAATNYNWLLLTDADCVPASDGWLEAMVAPLGKGKEIVAGYGGYFKTRGLLNAFIRWETLHTFLQYSTYALAGKPYMAVGRNLACTKSILQKAQQSDIWNALPSGDDDLLVRICGNKDNTAVVCDKQAFTYSDTKATWKEWIQQKQRHLSTGKYYKWNIKWLLAAYGCAHAVIWLGFFFLLFSDHRAIAAIIMGLRCIIYWVIWMITAGRLREKGVVYLFPLSDIGWMMYNFAFLPYITWKNKKHWT